MAISDAKKRRIGNELIDWIYLGIRTGARHRVAEYRKIAGTDPIRAEEILKAAVNMPNRARARINEARRLYEVRFGTGTFNAFIASCLSLVGNITIAEVNTALTALEAESNALITAHKNSTMTLLQIADWIDANWENESLDWTFPFPVGYKDNW